MIEADTRLLAGSALEHPRLLAGTLSLGLASALLNGAGLALVVPAFLLFLGGAVPNGAPRLLQPLLSLLPADRRAAWLLFVVIASIVLKNACVFASNYCSGLLRREIACDLRDRALRVALEVDVDFYTHIRLGDYLSRIHWETVKGAGMVMIVLRMAVVAATLLVFLALMLALTWKLTLITALLLTGVAAANQSLVRRARSLGALVTDRFADYSQALLEVLAGIRLVKAAGMEEAEVRRVSNLGRAREEAERRSFVAASKIGPVSEVAAVAALCAAIALGRSAFGEGASAVGASAGMLTYLVLVFRSLPLVQQLNDERAALAALRGAASSLPELVAKVDKPFMRDGTRPRERLCQSVRFEGVRFAYPGRPEVLQGFDLELPRGETVALVGASGGGKTTVALLLGRFYDPTSGRILMDGVDLRDLQLSSLRRGLAFVSQDVFLFNASVRENLAYGCPHATDSEILEAAQRAQALDFIEALPNGIHTRIGDRGVLLSGGQRQRLAIARALLQDADLLVLDEATSALDSVSERQVQTAIEEARRGRTTLVIAHRLSTLDSVDRVAVLDGGRVVEMGRPDDLLRVHGHYARLRALQR